MFVDSILNQTNKNWYAEIRHNGGSTQYWKEVMDRVPVDVAKESKLVWKQSSVDTGNWGTANRQQAIDECTTDYIIQTSVQDYWLPQAVQFILEGLESKPDILVWNSINHLVGKCQVLDAKLEWSKLDWGNFALKTSIAKQIPIRQTEYCADWLFVNDCIQKELIKTAKKLPYILTVHN